MSYITQALQSSSTTGRGLKKALQEEKDKKTPWAMDLLAAPVRGVEGAGQGIYNLVDYAMGDVLPDYDKRFFGTSSTMVGGFAEGAVQFMTGFIPIAGQLGKVGQVARLAKAGAKSKKFAKMAKKRKIARDVGAGVVADFTVFDGQEERLSNLMQNYKPLANPVSEYLAADKDDDEAYGRFKNSVEGLFIEAGMRGVGGIFTAGVRSMKKVREAKLAKDPETALTAMYDEIFEGVAKGKGLFRTRAEGKAFEDFADGVIARSIGDTADETTIPNLKDMTEQWIKSDAGQNSAYRPVFEQILKSNPEVLRDAKFGGRRNIKDADGQYIPDSRLVTLTDKKIRSAIGGGEGFKDAEMTYLHEVVHAVTYYKIEQDFNFKALNKDLKEKDLFLEQLKQVENVVNNKSVDSALRGLGQAYLDSVLQFTKFNSVAEVNVDDLFKTLKRRQDMGMSTYGLKNMHEFVAEAISNPKFFSQLSGGLRGKQRGLVSRVIHYLRELMGLSPELEGNFGEALRGGLSLMARQEKTFINEGYNIGKWNIRAESLYSKAEDEMFDDALESAARKEEKELDINADDPDSIDQYFGHPTPQAYFRGQSTIDQGDFGRGMQIIDQDDLIDEQGNLRQRLIDEGDLDDLDEVVPAANAKPEPSPIDLSKSGKSGRFFEKDVKKFSTITKLISRGSDKSSSNAYANAAGDLANSGVYSNTDIVGISAEGARGNRIAPDLEEIDRAVKADVTFVTDVKADRNRAYNVGEREVVAHLESRGYTEVEDGVWKSPNKQEQQVNPDDPSKKLLKTPDDESLQRAELGKVRDIDLETIEKDSVKNKFFDDDVREIARDAENAEYEPRPFLTQAQAKRELSIKYQEDLEFLNKSLAKQSAREGNRRPITGDAAIAKKLGGMDYMIASKYAFTFEQFGRLKKGKDGKKTPVFADASKLIGRALTIKTTPDGKPVTNGMRRRALERIIRSELISMPKKDPLRASRVEMLARLQKLDTEVKQLQNSKIELLRDPTTTKNQAKLDDVKGGINDFYNSFLYRSKINLVPFEEGGKIKYAKVEDLGGPNRFTSYRKDMDTNPENPDFGLDYTRGLETSQRIAEAAKRERDALQEGLQLNSGEFDEFFGDGFTDRLTERFKNEPQGSKEAIANIMKSTTSSAGVLHTLRTLARFLETETLPETIKDADLVETTQALLDGFGGSKDTFDALTAQLEGNKEVMNKIRLEQSAIKQVMDSLALDIETKARQYKEGGYMNVTENQKVEFFEQMDRLYETGRLWMMYGKEASKTLRQRKPLIKGEYGKVIESGEEVKPEGILGEVFETMKDEGTNNRRVGSELPTDATKSRYLSEVERKNKFERVVDNIVSAGESKHLANGDQLEPKVIAKFAKQIHGSKLMDMTLEYWTNSLLYGPTTQVVNLFGNALTFGLRAGELTVGSALSGNFALTRAALGAMFSFDMIRESVRIAARTFTEGQTLTQGNRAFSDDYVFQPKITADNVNQTFKGIAHISETGAVGKTINGLGIYSRVPSNMLGFGDELFKQLSYRYHAKTMLSFEGIKKGKTGNDLIEYVTKEFDNLLIDGRAYNQENVEISFHAKHLKPKIDEGVLSEEEAYKMMQEWKKGTLEYDPNKIAGIEGVTPNDIIPYEKVDRNTQKSRLAEASLKFARENTFTDDLDPDTAFGQISKHLNEMKRVPATRWISFIVPFVRTPTNILKFAIDRTPVGRDTVTLGTDSMRFIGKNLLGIQADYKSAILSDDPYKRANAWGKTSTAVGMAGTLYAYASQNLDFFTGGGPSDVDRKRALQMEGWQPYSVKIGDKYYSYLRLDPMSTVLGLYVDMAEAQKYHELDDATMAYMLQVGMLSFINNIGNKSFLQGIDNVMQIMSDPIGATFKTVGDIGAGFVPNYFPQLGNIEEFREIKEARTITDRILKRDPFFATEDSLMPKRNALGEKVYRENLPYGASVYLPLYASSISQDPVDKEIARLNKGFSAPKAKLMNALDMREVKGANGQTAYDRYQEASGEYKLNGKTLREALTALVQSPYYKGLNEGTDAELDLGVQPPRVKAMQKVINKYRRTGKQVMLQEFPELQSEVTKLLQRRRNL